MLLHHLQRITKLVELGFALLVGKQTGLDHEKLRQIRGANILPDSQRYFEVPVSLKYFLAGLPNRAFQLALLCHVTQADAGVSWRRN
jgi:hypothetical protein